MRGAARWTGLARALVTLGAAGAIGVGALTGATPALGDISTTGSGDGLALTLRTPGPVLAGVATNYTISVANISDAPIPDVTAEFQLPSEMSLRAVPANCVKNLFGGNSGPASCSFGTLAPGAVANVTVGILAAAPGSLTIGAAALAKVPLDGGGFQILSADLSLAVPVAPGPADIQVTGSSNNGSPPVGSPFTYTFQVKDNGSQGAAGVTFDDVLPPTISLSDFSTGLGTCTAGPAPNSVHCDLGSLAVGQQATIALTAVPTSTGTVTDTASIAMTGPDTQPANNTVAVTVQPR